MKIWIDDIRPIPKGYGAWCMSVNAAKLYIQTCENNSIKIELIDLDHDAGEYATDGGDYINLLNWLEETGRRYPIKIHSMNPVGIENMRRIIKRNKWDEIL